MRDIRSDLQERATLIDEQFRAAVAHFDKTVQQIQTERDARIAELKSGLAMIAKFMEFEERFLPKPPLLALAELFLRNLNDAGQMSRQELIDMAVNEGTRLESPEMSKEKARSMTCLFAVSFTGAWWERQITSTVAALKPTKMATTYSRPSTTSSLSDGWYREI